MNTSYTNTTQLKFVTLLFAIVAVVGCSASKASDRCYLEPAKYSEMREVFLDSGSYTVADESITEQQWLECERAQFRYQLRKEFGLDQIIDEMAAN